MSKTFITPLIRSVCNLAAIPAVRLASGSLPWLAASWLNIPVPAWLLPFVPEAELLFGVVAIAASAPGPGSKCRRLARLALEQVLPEPAGDLLQTLLKAGTPCGPNPASPPRLPDSLLKDGWWLDTREDRRPT